MCRNICQGTLEYFCSKVKIFSDLSHFQTLGRVLESRLICYLENSFELFSQSCLAPFLMPKGAQSGAQMLLQRDDRSSTGVTSVAMS